MTGIEIKLISNEKVRAAAQKADSQGEKAGNGYLDTEEIALFEKEAKASGCDKEEEFVKIMGFYKTVTELDKLSKLAEKSQDNNSYKTLGEKTKAVNDALPVNKEFKAQLAELDEREGLIEKLQEAKEGLSDAEALCGTSGALIGGLYGYAVCDNITRLAKIPVSGGKCAALIGLGALVFGAVGTWLGGKLEEKLA